MFEHLTQAPPDPLLGLHQNFLKDNNPKKINLIPGMIRDEQGEIPILNCVKIAEKIIYKTLTSKAPLEAMGMDLFRHRIAKWLFGRNWCIGEGYVFSAQTLGGSGALRIAGEIIKNLYSIRRVWASDPAWENYKQIFTSLGLQYSEYPYYNREGKCVEFNAMLSCLNKLSQNDLVIFQTNCHNPTGVDLTLEQWEEVARISATQKFLLLFDNAYQGFEDNPNLCSKLLTLFLLQGCSFIIANSFSKNFSLYNERIGSITCVGPEKKEIERQYHGVHDAARANYFAPPSHGAQIVATILTNPRLFQMWLDELSSMRIRLKKLRHIFMSALKKHGVEAQYITKQSGLFSLLNLSREQIVYLRRNYAIYIAESGRVSITGISEDNVDWLCGMLAEVLCNGTNGQQAIFCL